MEVNYHWWNDISFVTGQYNVDLIRNPILLPIEGPNAIKTRVYGDFHEGNFFGGWTIYEQTLVETLTFDYDSQTGVIFQRPGTLLTGSTGAQPPLQVLQYSGTPDYITVNPDLHKVQVKVGGDVSVKGQWSYGNSYTLGGSYSGLTGSSSFVWSRVESWNVEVGPWATLAELNLVRGATN